MYPQSMFCGKIKKYHKFSSENDHFFSFEKSQYITWAWFRNDLKECQTASPTGICKICAAVILHRLVNIMNIQ